MPSGMGSPVSRREAPGGRGAARATRQVSTASMNMRKAARRMPFRGPAGLIHDSGRPMLSSEPRCRLVTRLLGHPA